MYSFILFSYIILPLFIYLFFILISNFYFKNYFFLLVQVQENGASDEHFAWQRKLQSSQTR